MPSLPRAARPMGRGAMAGCSMRIDPLGASTTNRDREAKTNMQPIARKGRAVAAQAAKIAPPAASPIATNPAGSVMHGSIDDRPDRLRGVGPAVSRRDERTVVSQTVPSRAVLADYADRVGDGV